MRLGLLTLFNIFLFLFWFRIWVIDSRDTLFNHYLTPIARLSDRITDFLSPVFFGASQRVIALVSFVFLIFLRGMAVPYQSNWSIIMGFERAVNSADLPSCITFSLLSFLSFVFKIHVIAVIYLRTGGATGTHADPAISQLAKPFTDITPQYRPVALLVLGMIMVSLADIFGTTQFSSQYAGLTVDCILDWNNSPLPLTLTKVALITLAAGVQIIGLLGQLVFFFVVVSWISTFANSRPLSVISRESISFLLGPLRKRQVIIGTIDLTPLIFIVAATFIYKTLMQILSNSLDKL